MLSKWDLSGKSQIWGRRFNYGLKERSLKLTPNGLYLYYCDLVDQLYKVDSSNGLTLSTYKFLLMNSMNAVEILPSGM
jgi:hypothetical protein